MKENGYKLTPGIICPFSNSNVESHRNGDYSASATLKCGFEAEGKKVVDLPDCPVINGEKCLQSGLLSKKGLEAIPQRFNGVRDNNQLKTLHSPKKKMDRGKAVVLYALEVLRDHWESPIRPVLNKISK